MKKILITLLVLAMCFSFFACGKQESNSSDSSFMSLEELVSDPEFQQIFADEEDEYFTYAVYASDDTTLVYEVRAKNTYEEDDLDFFRNLTAEEISDKLLVLNDVILHGFE